MTLFTVTQLGQTENSDRNKILSISFEYLMASIAFEHAKLYGFKSVKEANESNRLSWPILAAYPFFVALANGNSKSLYSLFGSFYASSVGPISSAVWQLMDNNEKGIADRSFAYFKNPKSNAISNVQVIDITKYDSFYKIQEEAKNEPLSLEDGSVVPFKEIYIQCDELPGKNGATIALFSAIDSSIKIIQQQSGNTFFDGDLRTIKYQSTYFEALADVGDNAADLKVIEYDQVGSKELRPFYQEEMVH